MADEWGVKYRPRPKYQFVVWPRVQFWFVRDPSPLGMVYSWRLSLGPLEIRRWRHEQSVAVLDYDVAERIGDMALAVFVAGLVSGAIVFWVASWLIGLAITN